MRVLLINQIGHHQMALLRGVCDNVLAYHVEADLFNFHIGSFYRPTGRQKPLWFYVYKLLCVIASKPFLRRRLWKYALPFFVSELAKPYDVVDFQGLYSHAAMALVMMLKDRKKIRITVWGSDFYRQVGGSWSEKKKCFDISDLVIVATSQMRNDFLHTYPNLKDKIRIVNFGLPQLERLDEMLRNSDPLDASFLEIPKGAIVVTCGYNGIPTQQHLKMIEALTALPQEVKQELYVLFPMTYGLDANYLSVVKQSIQKMGIPYKILTERLPLDDLLTLRIMTDIAVNIQISDAMSASIQEHLMARNLLIAGNWLPYSVFHENGIYYRTTSLDHLTNSVMWAVENYQSVKIFLRNNTEKIYRLSSWKYVAPKQADIYKELQQHE